MSTYEEMQMQHDDDTRDDAIERLDAVLSALTCVGPTRDIAGYTYRADSYKPDELVELLIAEGRLAPGARGMDADEALDQLAAVEGIDREDEYTFDSDDFPKVVLRSQLAEDDLDWLER